MYLVFDFVVQCRETATTLQEELHKSVQELNRVITCLEF